MAGDIDEIKRKADIVQIISERIPIKKAGKHFRGLCPFHGEKTPSFMVSPELQIFKCFGCGESGDVITFLEKYEGMDFVEVIHYLSEKTGIKLQQRSFQPKKDKERILEINELIAKFYHYVLLNHELGKKALEYLTQKRKLTMDTIRSFEIGFSPENQKLFEPFFVQKKKISFKEMMSTGVCYEKFGKLIDRFAGRIIFPLYDHRGKTLGFSGRIMPGSRPDLAKYINTPETLLYHKSEILFGLNVTKDEIKKSGFAILTEGELDMISPWQRGIKNIVAIKGSAITEQHVKLLSRFTKNVVFALDADFAGNAAAKRGIEIAQNDGMNVKVARFKGYKDPDEMAIADTQGFSKCVKSAIPVYDFIIDSAFEKHDAESAEGKVNISKEVVPFISKIEDEIVKAYYIEKLSKKLKVPYESVYAEVEKKKIMKLSQDHNEKPEESLGSRKERMEEILLVLIIITDPYKLGEYKDSFFTDYIIKVASYLEKFCNKNKDKDQFDVKEFSDNLPAELGERFKEIYLLVSSEFENTDSQMLGKQMELLKRNIEVEKLSESQKTIIGDIKNSEDAGDKNAVITLQKKLNELLNVKNKLVIGNHR